MEFVVCLLQGQCEEYGKHAYMLMTLPRFPEKMSGKSSIEGGAF